MKSPCITFNLAADRKILEVTVHIDIIATIQDLLQGNRPYACAEEFETELGTLTLISRNIKVEWHQINRQN